MKITKKAIEKIKAPIDKAQMFYRDDVLKGFALRITKNDIKSFVVEKAINNKVKRITIGRYGVLTVEQARREAQKLLGKIASGTDPIAERKEKKANAITLIEVFEAYQKTRKNLKPKTIYDYQRVMNQAFKDWHKKTLLEITKDNVAKRHDLLGEKHGHAYANLSMRLLRALFNFAASQYEDCNGRSLILENPVKRLSQTRAWYRVSRRQTYIKPHELAEWYKAVNDLDNHALRDYLLLILFTGLRRQEAAKLKWAQVDLVAKTIQIIDTKNNEELNLPLPAFLCDLLTKLQQNKTNDFVFPGTGKGGYIIEPRRQITKIINKTGISFTIHDLRRTFITVAESLDISAYAVKKLVNHKLSSDVTSGYIVMDVERLRKPMQMICDYLLKVINVVDTDIIELPRAVVNAA